MDESLTCAGSRHGEQDRELVEQAVEYIKTYYMEPLTVANVAGQYGLSSRQFAYLFQKYTGMAPLEYLIECRVRRDRQLLCTTTRSVADIQLAWVIPTPIISVSYLKNERAFAPQNCAALPVWSD